MLDGPQRQKYSAELLENENKENEKSSNPKKYYLC